MSPQEQAEQMATEIMEELDFADREQHSAYVRRFLHELHAARRDALLEAAKNTDSWDVADWLRARAAEQVRTVTVPETGHPDAPHA